MTDRLSIGHTDRAVQRVTGVVYRIKSGGYASDVPDTRHAEALQLAEELLTDIELARLTPVDVARRASRLARLMDDAEAMEWLHFEIAGYTKPSKGFMDAAEVSGAERSGRFMKNDENDRPLYKVESIGEICASIDAANAALAALAGDAASGELALLVENSRRDQRYAIWGRITDDRGYLDAALGAIHEYVAARYQELRFGDRVESVFENLRSEVDATIARLVPGALPRLNAAFENATSQHSEHWANAASTCRRLLKEVADAIRPPGPDVGQRKMGEENYINRLVDWITKQQPSDTLRDVVVADLEYLGRRLDAVADAGHKGAHVDVSAQDASRFLLGTYIVLGDVLRLASAPPERVAVATDVAAGRGGVQDDLPTPSRTTVPSQVWPH